MSKFFVKNEQINGNIIKIKGLDVNHIKNVLRKKVEEEIIICNSENQKNYLCEIKKIEKEEIECEIQKELEKNKSNIEITIIQGMPKKDKMDLIIQKSVELGAFSIQPVEMGKMYS